MKVKSHGHFLPVLLITYPVVIFRGGSGSGGGGGGGGGSGGGWGHRTPLKFPVG